MPAGELGDPTNHLLINTTAQDGEDAFQKTALVVATPDSETNR
jgi:hypothetical protein